MGKYLGRLSIYSQNVNLFRGSSIEALSSTLQQYKPSVVCLQECNGNSLSIPDYTRIEGSGVDTAIFVRTSLQLDTRTIRQLNKYERCIIPTRYTTIVGIADILTIANVHLCGGRFDDAIWYQKPRCKFNMIDSVLGVDIIVGDFNSALTLSEYANNICTRSHEYDQSLCRNFFIGIHKYLTDKEYVLLGGGLEPTTKFGVTADFIYVRSHLQLSLNYFKVLSKVTFSDHFPIMAQVYPVPKSILTCRGTNRTYIKLGPLDYVYHGTAYKFDPPFLPVCVMDRKYNTVRVTYSKPMAVFHAMKSRSSEKHYVYTYRCKREIPYAYCSSWEDTEQSINPSRIYDGEYAVIKSFCRDVPKVGLFKQWESQIVFCSDAQVREMLEFVGVEEVVHDNDEFTFIEQGRAVIVQKRPEPIFNTVIASTIQRHTEHAYNFLTIARAHLSQTLRPMESTAMDIGALLTPFNVHEQFRSLLYKIVTIKDNISISYEFSEPIHFNNLVVTIITAWRDVGRIQCRCQIYVEGVATGIEAIVVGTGQVVQSGPVFQIAEATCGSATTTKIELRFPPQQNGYVGYIYARAWER